MSDREMLRAWAGKLSDRKKIEEFWDWLSDQYADDMQIYDIDIGKALDQFHGIDRNLLEQERSEMLSACADVGCESGVVRHEDS